MCVCVYSASRRCIFAVRSCNDALFVPRIIVPSAYLGHRILLESRGGGCHPRGRQVFLTNLIDVALFLDLTNMQLAIINSSKEL